jgi:hypothetical protein
MIIRSASARSTDLTWPELVAPPVPSRVFATTTLDDGAEATTVVHDRESLAAGASSNLQRFALEPSEPAMTAAQTQRVGHRREMQKRSIATPAATTMLDMATE